MHKKRLLIEDVYNDYETQGGVFSDLIQYPWSATISNDILNEMFMNEYGECYPAKMITSKTDSDGHLPSQTRKHFALMLATRYMKKWAKQWATLNFEYDPIANYDMTETETTDRDNTSNKEISSTTTHDGETTTTYDLADNTSFDGTQTNNLSELNSSTLTRNLTDSQEITVENTNSNTSNETQSTYGFNSSTAVPENTTSQSKSDTINQSSEDTSTHTGTESNSSTQTNTGTVTNENESTSTKTGTETFSDDRIISLLDNTRERQEGSETRLLSRKGNIGTLTTQTMILSERNLYAWDFFKEVFHDIIKMIIIPIY